MKLLIAWNALLFVLFTAIAVMFALQNQWVLTAIWSLGALCWVASGIMRCKTLKLRDY